MSKSLRTPNGYRIWGAGSFAHICFESPGCKFRKKGYCIMCDYGAGHKLSVAEAVSFFTKAVSEWPVPIKRLLLGTCGSILDEEEFSHEALLAIVKIVQETHIESVIFETHYSTVKNDLLHYLSEHLQGKHIAIELGFESSNQDILKNNLRKYMDLNKLADTISLIKKYDISPILNVFLGSPGLTSKEQMDDTLQSIRWAYTHGASEVVIFPANVKPGTGLWHQFIEGSYKVPSSWLLVEVLNRLSNEELETTSISWFGDRQQRGEDIDIIPPKTCPKCDGQLHDFFSCYMSVFSATERRRLLNQIAASKPMCECRIELYNKIEIEGEKKACQNFN